MLSVRSSRISINCPDLTFSTSLGGKGAAAGDNISPPLAEGGVGGKEREAGVVFSWPI